MTSRKRRKLVPERISTNTKKRLAYPRRHTALMHCRPRRRSSPAARSSMRALQPQLLYDVRARIMERHRPVHLAPDELVHEGRLGIADVVGRAVRHHHALRHEIDVIDDLQRFLHVVRYQYRRGPESVVQMPDEI